MHSKQCRDKESCICCASFYLTLRWSVENSSHEYLSLLTSHANYNQLFSQSFFHPPQISFLYFSQNPPAVGFLQHYQSRGDVFSLERLSPPRSFAFCLPSCSINICVCPCVCVCVCLSAYGFFSTDCTPSKALTDP